ncbi:MULTISPECIES: hydrolase [Bacillaceae]|uniref:hydrolase n=1 Tax=Bacillaceae TaxID=186817 RepID=UPI001C57B165|nr:hydrolase [Rossellomorea sp. YZS02]MBW3111319.1 hydrolase [Bacillus sp. MCCB 382]MDX8346289.1 hydrolase [Rossellomorea sp. YZS02]
METKQIYYVDISSGDILQDPNQSASPSFRISATPTEVNELKMLFNDNYDDDMSTMRRAQVPFRQYHNSPEDDRYDQSMKDIYSKIYLLGDEEARRHIVNIGVLERTRETPLREDIKNLK